MYKTDLQFVLSSEDVVPVDGFNLELVIDVAEDLDNDLRDVITALGVLGRIIALADGSGDLTNEGRKVSEHVVNDGGRVLGDVLGPGLNAIHVLLGLLAGVKIRGAVLDELDDLLHGIDDLGRLEGLELIKDVLDLLLDVRKVIDASLDLG